MNVYLLWEGFTDSEEVLLGVFSSRVRAEHYKKMSAPGGDDPAIVPRRIEPVRLDTFINREEWE